MELSWDALADSGLLRNEFDAPSEATAETIIAIHHSSQEWYWRGKRTEISQAGEQQAARKWK